MTPADMRAVCTAMMDVFHGWTPEAPTAPHTREDAPSEGQIPGETRTATSGPLLDPNMPSAAIRLHMGELTAAEEMAARAAIRWANTRIVSRALSERERLTVEATASDADVGAAALLILQSRWASWLNENARCQIDALAKARDHT